MILSTVSGFPETSFSFDTKIPFPYIATHMKDWSSGVLVTRTREHSRFTKIHGSSTPWLQHSMTPTLHDSDRGKAPVSLVRFRLGK